MSTLLDVQRGFASALATGDVAGLSEWIADADRIHIHRNTMRGALTGALRLAYPATDALVGTEFFDRAAVDFIQLFPPASALLTRYGAGFGEFLATYAPASGLRYLADVARLEWAVDTAAHAPAEDEAAPSTMIDLAGTRLAFAPSLTLLRADYPAEPIWRAVLDGDDEAIGRIDPRPAPTTLAVWRQGDGATVAPLDPAAFAFLAAIFRGASVETALAAAGAADPDPIPALTAEILSAGFVRLTPLIEGEEE